MPFPMKIQPIDARSAAARSEAAAKPPPPKSRLKRLFERRQQQQQLPKLAGDEVEAGSVCLDKLVVNFMEEGNGNEKSAKCSRSRCNCFNGNCDDSSDDEFSGDPPLPIALEVLKGLVPCESLAERNLLADAAKIMEANKSKIGKGKDNCIKIVADSLRSVGLDASICTSRWGKTPLIPAGEYDYIDVVIDGERYIVDVDFRSEFEIARSTKAYRAVLQSLPSVFVGRPERVQRIVAVASEAARQSLKKKGLHFPPWRKPEYMKSKWLAPHERAADADGSSRESGVVSDSAPAATSASSLITGEVAEMRGALPESWTPPAVRPKSAAAAGGSRVVTGLSSVLSSTPPPPPSPPADDF